MASQKTETSVVIADEEEIVLNIDYYLDQLSDSKLRDQFTSTTISIPLKVEGEEVAIDTLNDLPDDPNELCSLLSTEECISKYWILVSKAYANQGKIDDALTVISQALQNPFIISSGKKEYSELNNFAAWLNILKADLFNDSTSFELAKSELNAASSTLTGSEDNEYNILAEAVLSLSTKKNRGRRTKFDTESRNFDMLLQKNPKNCYALLGKGKLFFYRQNYINALRLFQKVLQLNPLLRPDPRIGIGLCYWFLDRKDLATQAWQNSIQVNHDNNLEAKILISIAKFDDCFLNSTSDEDFKAKYTEAMSFTQASYKESPRNEVIQIILASYFFAKGDIKVVENICGKIFDDKASTNFVKSEALFWLARCKLASGDVLQAQKSFSDSIKLNDNNVLARIGYSQCLVIRGEINDAIRILEKIHESNFKILEVTYALGMLYSKIEKSKKKSIEYLEKYVKVAEDQNEPVSTASWITLAKLYEEIDISKSLEYSIKAKDEEIAAGKSDEEISAILFNNIGVFTLLENRPSGAEEYFEKAYKNVKYQYADDEKAEEALEITLKYNIARAKEQSNDFTKLKDAQNMYNDILEKCPHYTNAKIRWLTIACLTEDKNVKEEVEQLLNQESDDMEVRSFYGWYLSRFGKKHGVEKPKDLESDHHKETVTKYDSHDCYALLSLANVYCTLAREIKDQKKKDQYYIRATQLYQKVLTLDSKNAYAAQGIAIIFAEEKQTALALEIFRKVRDSLNDITVYLNMGHCLLEVKQFAKAIECYDLALTRFTDGKDARLLNYFARAWLFRAIHERNLDYFQKALTYVNKSFELNPIPSYQFNITFIEYQLADFIRKLTPAKRNMEDLEKSIKGLEDSIVILNSMTEDSNIHAPYPIEDLKMRVMMGKSLLKQLEKALDEQKEYENTFQTKLKEAKKLKEEQERQKEEERLIEEEKRKKIEEKLLAERKELEQQQAEWNLLRMEEEKDNQDMLDKDPEPKEKKKRGRKKKEDSNGEEKSSKKRKTTKVAQKKSSLSKEFIDDSDDEAEFSEGYDDNNDDDDDDNVEGDDNDNDSDSKESNAETGNVERKKAAISDDEEDDDNEGDNNHDDNVSKPKIVDDEEEDDDGLF